MQPLPLLFFVIVLFGRPGSTLQVTPGSTCAALCLDNPETDSEDPKASNTSPKDIVCTDEEYETGSTGIKYKNCIECLQKSNATIENENDISWFLYNVRYTVDVCVFGFPNATKEVSSPCDIISGCQPLKKALEAGNLTSTGDQYDYCTADDGKFTSPEVDACIQCFASSSKQGYMSNFITALKAGCQQKPEPGVMLGLSNTLFTGSLITITDPPETSLPPVNTSGSGAMTTGAIVGIAVGAGLLFIGGVGLFWVYHRKKKRMFGEPIESRYGPRGGNKSISPPLAGAFSYADQKPISMMSDYELRSQRGYTDNGTCYDQLEKEMQTRRQNYAYDPNRPGAGPHGTLPTHPAYLPRTHSRQSSRDASPQPPRPVKSNASDSFALQAYLRAAQEANDLGLMPPPPRTAEIRGSTHSRGSSFSSRGPSPDMRPLLSQNSYDPPSRSSPPLPPQSLATSLPNPPPPPPPPPPRGFKVPSLSIPSVPLLRMPKKYSPPQINIQGATPIEGPSADSSLLQQQENVPTGFAISRPMVDHESRTTNNPFYEDMTKRKKTPPPPLVVEQSASERSRPWRLEDPGPNTGKSSMYG